MKILHYNFAQPDQLDAGAGGVGTYLRNIVLEFVGRGQRIACLSSGGSYAIADRAVKLTSWNATNYQALDIINSPVLAPFYLNFFSLDVYLDSPTLDEIPALIKDRAGAIDIFHFHNIEGLTLRFFYKLRATFPNSAMLLSAHNYSLVCPQVNLWRYDRETCLDFEDGRACVSCIGFQDVDHHRRVKEYNSYLYNAKQQRFALPKRGAKTPDVPEMWRSFDRSKKVILRPGAASIFKRYRQANVEMADKVFDRIVAVSERTKKVLVERGTPEHKIVVSYIGSRHVVTGAVRRTDFTDPLRICYFGYPRRDKGFFFFLDALECMSIEMTRRIAISIVASVGDGEFISRIAALARRYADVQLINGYTAEDLGDLLKDAHLGVVPPLWEDNLPQVAIEYVAHGVPILVSNIGGASEISRNPNFSFQAGSKRSFIRMLRRILDREVPLSDFWATEPNIHALSTHVDELHSLYAMSLRSGSRRSVTAMV